MLLTGTKSTRNPNTIRLPTLEAVRCYLIEPGCIWDRVIDEILYYRFGFRTRVTN